MPGPFPGASLAQRVSYDGLALHRSGTRYIVECVPGVLCSPTTLECGDTRLAGGTVAAGDEMRVSDAEREAAAAELQEHFASGRLDQEELNERLAAAFAARTRGELNALFTDLPGGRDWSGTTADAGRIFDEHSQFGPDNPQPGWQSGGRIGLAIATLVGLVPVLAVLGVVSLLSLGGNRPFGFVLIFAAFALLRRLLFVIFGRRKRGGGRGPRRGPRRRR